MYPTEPKPPNKKLVSLVDIKDIDDITQQVISGYCIKGMTSDPYGHPVFAAMDVKVSYRVWVMWI